MLGDALQVAIPVCRLGLGRLARHGCVTRRHDDRRLGGMRGNRGGNAVPLIVGIVGGDGGHGSRYLIEQGAHLGAVLLDPPPARAAELQAGTVHQQVERFVVPARSWARHLQCLGPAAPRGVVRHAKSKADDGADQAPRLTQGEAKHAPERRP